MGVGSPYERASVTSPRQDEVVAAIQSVVDPLFGKPMLALGLVSGVQVSDGRVSLRFRLCAPSEPYKRDVEAALRAAVARAGASELAIDWDLQVPTRDTTGEDPAPGVRNVVLVMSGKGGVGKSTCAVNLAMALARAGAKVGLLDADIYGPSIPTMLGVNEHPQSKDGVSISPVERFGLKLMSIGFLLDDPKSAVVWRGPMLHGALGQFLKDVDWGKLDYLLVDLPPGTGDVALSLAQRIRVTGVVMVTTPQEVALQDVYKAVSMCKKLNLKILGVVENMSWFIDSAGVRHELFGRGGGAKIAEASDAPLLGQIPLEPTVRERGDEGTPIVHAAPGSTAGVAFAEIAEAVATTIALLHFERTGGTKVPDAEGPTRLKIVR